MKKLVTLAAILAFSSSAMAGFQGNHSEPKKGFRGKASTVAQAKKAYDNAPFSIVGNIINCFDEDNCTFRDSTGQINIDIDDDAWRNINVSPNDRIRISGQVDVDDDTGRRTLDVERISR